MQPKISVIIPIYNTERFLTKCLDSICNQSLTELEILLINDGSTDNSLQLITAYAKKDSRIIVKSIPNSGVANARNIALSLATGEYLAFCDSDDIVPNDAYFNLYNEALKENYDLVVGSYADIYVSSDDTEECRNANINGNTKFSTIFTCPCLWHKLIKNDIVAKNNVRFQSKKVGEDVIFLSDIYKHISSYSLINKVVYKHFHYQSTSYTSLNNTYNYEYFKDHIACREKIIEQVYDGENDDVLNYVLIDLTSFLITFFNRTFESTQRALIFRDLQIFLSKYKTYLQKDRLENILGVNYDVFMRCSANEYVLLNEAIIPRDRVALEFKHGLIGFKFILKYIKLWLKYKLTG